MTRVKKSSKEHKTNGVKADPIAEKKSQLSGGDVKSDKKKKSSKRQPTPPPVESSSGSSDESDDSSSSSGSESDSDPKSKSASLPKTNGTAKAREGGVKPRKDSASSSASESSGSDESSSESDSGAALAAPAPSKTPAMNGKASKVGKVSKADSSGSESSGSSDSDSDVEMESPAKAGKTPNAAVVQGNGVEASDDGSDSGSSEGSSEGSDSGSESEAEAAAVPAKKRKADTDDEPVAKKAKTDVPENASKNLFVGSLSWNIDDAWLSSEFSSFGECTARVMTDRTTGRSKGFGFVEFTNIEDAVKAHDEKAGTQLDGRDMNVDYTTPRAQTGDRGDRVNNRADKFGDAKNNPSDTLWVGNVSFGATAEMFEGIFAEYGSVTRVHLPTDMETGSLKGFGHIGMGSVEEAKAAYEALNGSEVDGRSIRLDYATPRQDRDGGGGGRGGGRGGGFRGGRGGGDRGGFRGGRGGDRGGRGGRGDFRGGRGGGRGGSTNRGGFGDFSGNKVAF